MQSSTMHNSLLRLGFISLLLAAFCGCLATASREPAVALTGKDLSITPEKDGAYSVRDAGQLKPVLRAGVAAQVDHHWLRSSACTRRRNSSESQWRCATPPASL